MAKKTTSPKADGSSFNADEKAAMKERAAERKKSQGKSSLADDEADCLAKIAEMPEADRVLASRVHELIKQAAPGLAAKTWYGMPAYARDGKVICFFQNASKFKYRYATLGFSDQAALDEGTFWPTSYALISLTKAVEARIQQLVRQAVSASASR